jgi:hypothetical protein
MAERSSTHAITNHTVFSSEELRAQLLDLIDPRASIPQALLPTFLHEATHHWCFTSSVGTAIAILAMRGRVSALRAIEASTPQDAKMWELRAADDITRAEVALQLLRPLAEGMATFAEFDLSGSQRSPVVPPPLRWAMMFTARDQLTGSDDSRARRRMDLAQKTTIALTVARQSERTRRAKEALLVEPLSCQHGEGYLVGYLVIKALWRYMRNRHDRFIEPEVFMLKIYDLFYEDFAFIRLLLDPSQTIPAALDPLTQHFSERLKSAFGESKDALDAFVGSLVSARSQLYQDQTAEGRVLPLAESLDRSPSARFHALWEVVVGPRIENMRGVESNSKMLEAACFMIGYGRVLLKLGELPAQMTVAEAETVVHVNGQLKARLDTIHGAPTGQTDGALHILLNTRSGEHVVAVTGLNGNLLALRKTSETAKGDVSTTNSVKGLMAGHMIADAIIEGARESLQILRELTRLGGYLQQSHDRLDMIYGPCALIYVPEDKLEELLGKMTTNGMYGAFDYEADLVRALAIIGSTAHLSWMPEHLKSEFGKNGLDYEALMGKLRACARSTNLFVLNEELGVRCSL